MGFLDVARGAVWLTVLQGLNYVVPLATVPVITRAFGLETFGMLSTMLAYTNYIGLIASYGSNLTGPKSITAALARQEDVSEVFSRIFVTQMLVGILSSAMLMLPLAYLGDRETVQIGSVLLLYSLVNQLSCGWAFIGLGRMKEFTVINLVVKITGVLAILILVRHQEDVLLYVSINLVMAGAVAICSVVVANRLGMRLKLVRVVAVKRTLRESFGLFFSTISISLYTNSCVLVVSGIMGPSEAGLYALADRIRQAVMGVFGPVSQALYPFICRQIATADGKIGDEKTRILFFWLIALLGLTLSFCIYLFAPIGVVLLGGRGFLEAAEILQIMSPVPFVIALSSLLGVQTLIPNGLEKQFSLVISIAGGTGIAVVALGTFIGGLRGAAVAYVLVETTITIAFAAIVHYQLGVGRTFGWDRLRKRL